MNKTSKVVAVVLMVLTAPGLTFAELAKEQPSAPKTKMEAFQAQTGSVVVKGYTDIGKVSSLGTVEVTAMEFADVSSSKKISGIVIEVTESGRLENSDRAFIDYDEIPDLLKGLDYVSRATTKITNHPMFEATYSTKGDFKITAFSNRKGEVSAVVQSGSFRPARIFLELNKLAELRGLIEKAKSIVESKR